MITLRRAPRAVVQTGLTMLRLPLSAVETVTRRVGSEWQPAVVYESFEAAVKRVVGSAVGDQQLVREGVLQSHRVDKLEEAEALETRAEIERQEAESTSAARQRAAAERRRRADGRASDRATQRNTTARRAEKAIDDEQTQLEQVAEKAARRRASNVAAAERRAERTRLDKESAAVARREEAVKAAQEVSDIEDRISQTKEQRRTARRRPA